MPPADVVELTDNLGDLMRRLFACQDALEDIWRQTGGHCPAGVEPMTWARVRMLMESDK